MQKQTQKHQQLNEGLRSNDLKDFVDGLFTVDQYRSKMGEDKDVVVLGFRVTEKNPAADLMEFMERGYQFILDADMSSGEEHDGHYQVFVEIERTPNLPGQVESLLRGISQLTDIHEWRFRYQKSPKSVEYTKETIKEQVPLTPAEYEHKVLEIKNTDIKEFFDQGSISVELDEHNQLTFSKSYSGDVNAKFISIGDYENVKDTVPGAISLDEGSQSQVVFLEKYLGNYEINKIGDKFLIRNKDKAVVIKL
jgi:multimeric flavodoxin WrbA